jgi:hypothetical protein
MVAESTILRRGRSAMMTHPRGLEHHPKKHSEVTQADDKILGRVGNCERGRERQRERGRTRRECGRGRRREHLIKGEEEEG